MEKLYFVAAVFLATGATLQVLRLVATLIVHCLFPEWEEAKRRLHVVNAAFLQYTLVATLRVFQYLPWMLMALFALLTVAYS